MEKITLAHGAGGSKSRELIEKVFVSRFGNPELGKLADGAVLGLTGGEYVLTTDTHVIEPIFFSGGDIGKLAVCGSVNDVVVCGAAPKWMSCGFILEEGFNISDLERVVDSMAQAAAGAGVKIVTGDTKVVGPGQADKIYINTTAVGQVVGGYGPKDLAAGDGSVADNVKAMLSVLDGNKGPKRDIVLLNAAAALMVADKASDLRDGMAIAADSIDSGAATNALNKFKSMTQELGEG